MNELNLVGRLVRKPVLQVTDSGIPFARIVLAVERSYKRRKTTDFINIIIWRRQAEVVCKYVDKGSLVLVNGYIHSDSYMVNNEKRYVLEMVVHTIKFLENKDIINKRLKSLDNKKIEENIVFAGFENEVKDNA